MGVIWQGRPYRCWTSLQKPSSYTHKSKKNSKCYKTMHDTKTAEMSSNQLHQVRNHITLPSTKQVDNKNQNKTPSSARAEHYTADEELTDVWYDDEVLS